MRIPSDEEVRDEVKVVEPKYRQCPQSLREFVAFTYRYVFGSAKRFSTVPWVRPRDDRFRAERTVSEHFVNKVIKTGKGELKYRQLEQIADLYGVPVSVVLMFTRCYADQRDKKRGAKTPRDVQKLYTFFERLPELSAKVETYASFLDWVDAYHGNAEWRRKLEERVSNSEETQLSLGIDDRS